MHIYFFIVQFLPEKLDLTLITKRKFELFPSSDMPVKTIEYFLFISTSCWYLLLRFPLFLVLIQQLISFGLWKQIFIKIAIVQQFLTSGWRKSRTFTTHIFIPISEIYLRINVTYNIAFAPCRRFNHTALPIAALLIHTAMFTQLQYIQPKIILHGFKIDRDWANRKSIFG